jgi:hypothetical protein
MILGKFVFRENISLARKEYGVTAVWRMFHGDETWKFVLFDWYCKVVKWMWLRSVWHVEKMACVGLLKYSWIPLWKICETKT